MLLTRLYLQMGVFIDYFTGQHSPSLSQKLKELYDTVGSRARIAAYLKSDRRAKYSEGIYRYYAELDE